MIVITFLILLFFTVSSYSSEVTVGNIDLNKDNPNIDIRWVPKFMLFEGKKNKLYIQVPVNRDIYNHEINELGLEFVFVF